ncbi:MAG: 4Fe-4S dicluster domain-containing protein [Acidobacteriota bacterium]
MSAQTPRGWWLTERELREWFQQLIADGTKLVGPVDEDDLRIFRQVTSADSISLAAGKTQWSPKEFLLPRSEPLYAYTFEDGAPRLRDPEPLLADQAIVGVRPCDAAGLARLDSVFLSGTRDPHYQRRRDRTTVVSLSCVDATPDCFCTAAGGTPHGEEGADAILIPLAGRWLLRSITPKGAGLLARQRHAWPESTAEHDVAAENQRRRVEESMRRSPVMPEWPALLDRAFDLPVWQHLGERCMSCSICSYVCPSCSCFDMQDEGNPWCGSLCRSWDSCTFGLFTRHASGHNPRPTQVERYRQRVLHKFAYFPMERDGRLMCVGCGRCILLCPAGIDIYEAVRAVVEAQRNEVGASERS